MRVIPVRHRPLVAMGMFVALAATSVVVLTAAPWASGTTQFRHAALSPAFQLGSDQGFNVQVTNVGATTVSCRVDIRGPDGSLLLKRSFSLPPGETATEGAGGPLKGQQTLRVVISSVSASRANPCLGLIGLLSSPGSTNHVDATISDFLVKVTSA